VQHARSATPGDAEAVQVLVIGTTTDKRDVGGEEATADALNADDTAGVATCPSET
jgi:hypothetical protein